MRDVDEAIEWFWFCFLFHLKKPQNSWDSRPYLYIHDHPSI